MNICYRLSCLLVMACCVSSPAVELPDIFSDAMVLQRDRDVPVWGKATPGASVTVTFAGESVTTATDDEGMWIARIPTGPASAEGRVLQITSDEEGDDHAKAFKDVLVGEVWHCSGQSNMGWTVKNSNNAEQEVADANYPQIRLFRAPRKSVPEPQFTGGGTWEVCSPETVGPFSAVGYFFGRKLYQDLDIPIGLINTPWGGAAAEAYTSWDSLAANEVTRPFLTAFEAEVKKLAEEEAAGGPKVDPASLPERQPEPENVGYAEGLAATDYDDSAWTEMAPMSNWAEAGFGRVDGVLWMRKTVELPEGLQGKALMLNLGAIDDADITYVNGVEVGRTPVTVKDSYLQNRRYTVPAELTATDSLLIAVRVFDHFSGEGFQGPAEQFFLASEDDATDRVQIEGKWKAMLRHKQDPGALRAASGRKGRGDQHKPGYLYNGMIVPVAPYAIRGVIWYQGETNAGRAKSYELLMSMLIDDWRALWDQPGEDHDFPFIQVQLANFQQPVDEPRGHAWAALRDAQWQAARNHPRTYMATAIDVGEAKDIHPRNKQEVGRRLALIALRQVYGQSGFMDQGPSFSAAEPIVGDGPAKMRLSYDYASGLTTRDGQPPRGFAVLNPAADTWQWAEAQIDGTDVILTAPDGVEAPFAVRYAWEVNPAEGPQAINLVNGEGLPALPFSWQPAATTASP